MSWFAKLKSDLACIRQTGKTVRGFALSRHAQLQGQYIEEMYCYYLPPGQRKRRSADSLYSFSAAQMLADEAKHSIAIGEIADAHKKIDQGMSALRDAAHHRFLEELRGYARQRSRRPRA